MAKRARQSEFENMTFLGNYAKNGLNYGKKLGILQNIPNFLFYFLYCIEFSRVQKIIQRI